MPSAHVLVPEILAPVGGRQQFFAALNSGADAVFLGLKNFNARARAENFTTDDLRELVPLAKRHGMNVLVTMNILIKNTELQALIQTLADLEDIGVHAIIVQDVGLARLCRTYFPNLRMHASTQLAVHNLDGVREAVKLGFKRVVLARELTALEIKKIRAAIPREHVELEAFCHGSLCYSYSGLCFFSGAEDARSGNRGECAYTCRKPYKILNEPGHGFLFSMKDLNTIENLELLVDAGVDTLKIEGRKKDAQYVSSVVRAYRNKLDQIFSSPTLRPNAPVAAHLQIEQDAKEKSDPAEQLNLTFQRNSTSFFLKGRYHENVIDLNNPTHKGQFVGTVESVRGRVMTLLTECPLARFDGLRIDPQSALYHSTPQHGAQTQTNVDGVRAKYNNMVCHFSLRLLAIDARPTPECKAGDRVQIEIPEDLPLPVAGDHVYRTRSDALRQSVERLSKPPADTRLRPFTEIDLKVEFISSGDSLCLRVSALKFGKLLTSSQIDCAAIRPRSGTSTLTEDLQQLFSTLGNIGFSAQTISFEGDSGWFIPRGHLKELKRSLEDKLPSSHTAFLAERLAAALESVSLSSAPQHLQKELTTLSSQTTELNLKIDRLEYLSWISEFIDSRSSQKNKFTFNEIVFEPKRAFLPELSFADVLSALKTFSSKTGVKLRLAFPTVLRAWDEPLMKRWAQEFFSAGITDVEVGNVSHLGLLERWGLRSAVTSISSDFTLYTLNQQAAAQWQEMGLCTAALSVEDDSKNIESLVEGFPEGLRPQAILYKDTPLFIAESCSLTALHNGCPTNKVCGYRTLEIQNDEGETFYVAHESCKSIVYAKEPFALSHQSSLFERLGVRSFRADFLTRSYTRDSLLNVLTCLMEGKEIKSTHTANFNRTLL